MATLVRPPALHVRAVSGGGNKDRVAPQRPWWGGNKPISPRQSGGSGARGGAGGVALDQVLGVLRRDGEFVQAAVGAPLRDVFWLRFLEKKQRKQQQPRPKHKPFRQQQEEEEVVVVDESPPAFPPPSYPSGLSCVELMAADFQALKVYAGSARHSLARRFLGSNSKGKSEQQPKPKPQEQQKEQQHILQAPAFPPPSYPPGLSCIELMMADLEALKLYINYYSAILTTPLPQHYDPDLLAQYFASRPHILASRVIQILFTFLSAVVKMRISKRAQLTTDATYSSGNSGNGFDDTQYMVGQLLKETFLNLGPTFIKVGQSLSTRPDIIGSEICEVRPLLSCMKGFLLSQERMQ